MRHDPIVPVKPDAIPAHVARPFNGHAEHRLGARTQNHALDWSTSGSEELAASVKQKNNRREMIQRGAGAWIAHDSPNGYAIVGTLLPERGQFQRSRRTRPRLSEGSSTPPEKSVT